MSLLRAAQNSAGSFVSGIGCGVGFMVYVRCLAWNSVARVSRNSSSFLSAFSCAADLGVEQRCLSENGVACLRVERC